jgi:hypothetical protein
MLVDYRLHPAIQAAEDRVRGSRYHVAPQKHETWRVFRIGASRPAAREMGRR